MRPADAVWNVLGLAVTLITIFVPAYVAYDIYGRGTIPEKRVQLVRLGALNPLSDLSELGDKATFSLRVEGKTINNLAIAQGWLENTGKSPILPTDYFEHLSVSVPKPWRILDVGNRSGHRTIRLHWKKVTDIRFEADPALLNPGDRVQAVIYLTNTEYTGPKNSPLLPEVKWDTRITNLQGFSEAPSVLDTGLVSALDIGIFLDGWAVPFLIVIAILFEALYLRLFFQIGLLQQWPLIAIASVLAGSALSFSAAECAASLIFPTPIGVWVSNPRGYWLNWVVLSAHCIALITLYAVSRRARTPTV